MVNADALVARLRLSRVALEIAKSKGGGGGWGKWQRYPAGTSKGGQFAPKGGGSGGSSVGNMWSNTFHEVGGPGWGHYAKPKAPPPGAKPHPKTDDHGKAVSIDYPSKPSHSSSWGSAKQSAVFVPGGEAPKSLHGVPMKPWSPPEKGWASVTGTNPKIDIDFPFEPHPTKKTGAGVLIVEPDGRLWLTRPTNAFGGYQNTYPKGTAESGLTLQQNAIKEAWEETGLKVKITGVLGDYDRDTSRARFYIAVREGGTPRDMGWESQAMTLATMKDARTLLNRSHDRDILTDLEELFSIAKKNPGTKGGHWQNQPRWPGGSALGGQWKTMGADGITLPPVVAGGLEGKYPQYQKKIVAIHAAAQQGDKTKIQAVADKEAKYATAFAAGDKNSGHMKWHASVHQYALQVLHDVDAGTKATTTADRMSGPPKLSEAFGTVVGNKPGGSNPGAMHADKSGEKWLIKGNKQLQIGSVSQAVSDDRARNEVLASKLMIAAGVGAPEMKLVDLQGKYGGGLGVASKWMPGSSFNPNLEQHIGAARSDFAVHAWLANYDVLGMGFDNTTVHNGKAQNIDPGGALLFRAQGLPKGESHGVVGGLLDKTAPEFESMRKTTQEQKHVYGGMTQSDLYASAEKLKAISDDTIRDLVKTYGPGNADARAALAQNLIDRKNAILTRAGHIAEVDGKGGISWLPTSAKSSAAPEALSATSPASSVGAGLTGEAKLLALAEAAKAAGSGINPTKAVGKVMDGTAQDPAKMIAEWSSSKDPGAPQMVAFWSEVLRQKQAVNPAAALTPTAPGAGLTGEAKLIAIHDEAKAAGVHPDSLKVMNNAIASPDHFTPKTVSNLANAWATDAVLRDSKEAKFMVAFYTELLAQKQGAAAPSQQPAPTAPGAGLTGLANLTALAQAAKDAGGPIGGDPKVFAQVAVLSKSPEQLAAAVKFYKGEVILGHAGAKEMMALYQAAIAYHQSIAAPGPAVGAGLTGKAKLEALLQAAQDAGGHYGSVSQTASDLLAIKDVHTIKVMIAHFELMAEKGQKGAKENVAAYKEALRQHQSASSQPGSPPAGAGQNGRAKLAQLLAAAQVHGAFEKETIENLKSKPLDGLKSQLSFVQTVPEAFKSDAHHASTLAVLKEVIRQKEEESQKLTAEAGSVGAGLTGKAKLEALFAAANTFGAYSKETPEGLMGKSLKDLMSSLSFAQESSEIFNNAAHQGAVVALLKEVVRQKQGEQAQIGEKLAEAVVPPLPKAPEFSTGFKTADAYYAKLTDKVVAAHASGDIVALTALASKKDGTAAWPSHTQNGKKMQEFYDALLADAKVKQAGNVAAGVQMADAALSTPASIKPGPTGAQVALPDFEAAKLPASHSHSVYHNGKIDTIAKLAQAGDIKGLLSVGVPNNYPGSIQAKAANDALAALGSSLTVTKGQKKNSHPALFGGVDSATAHAAMATVGLSPPKPAIAKPNPAALDVSKAVIEAPPTFTASSKAWVNEQNNALAKKMFEIAQSGNLTALQSMTFQAIDKETGQVTQRLAISNHPSKPLFGYHQLLVQTLDEIANPPEPLKAFSSRAVSSFEALSKAFPSVPHGTTVAKMPKNQQLGFWVALGKIENPKPFIPKETAPLSPSMIQQAYAKHKTAPPIMKKWIDHMQSSSSLNTAYRDGKTEFAGMNLKEATKAALDYATEKPAGTTIWRWQKMSADMIAKIMSTEPGTIIQATGPMCCSYSETATKGFGSHKVEIVYAPGAKAVTTFGSGEFSGEKEVTTLPNSRFVLLSAKKTPADKVTMRLLMLPPDPGL